MKKYCCILLVFLFSSCITMQLPEGYEIVKTKTEVTPKDQKHTAIFYIDDTENSICFGYSVDTTQTEMSIIEMLLFTQSEINKVLEKTKNVKERKEIEL